MAEARFSCLVHRMLHPGLQREVQRFQAKRSLSALQKAIRRGEEDLALRAAMNLMIGGPHAIWRRLGIIAFEDISGGLWLRHVAGRFPGVRSLSLSARNRTFAP